METSAGRSSVDNNRKQANLQGRLPHTSGSHPNRIQVDGRLAPFEGDLKSGPHNAVVNAEVAVSSNADLIGVLLIEAVVGE